ncbi:MAG: 4-hydroxythreonine-4-phosphate dehydrogenase PdxA [Opitutales bacterium]|nr:4-hydroxythreonine-4-phosphate dehydrogenase PdxA [Opitutales bacterium]
MKKIALTVGDPSGVGPEIIAAWAKANPLEARGVEVLAHARLLENLPDFIGKREISSCGNFEPGKPCRAGAQLALDALEAAALGCMEGRYGAVATCPVSKICMVEVCPNFVGQTEFFQQKWGGDAVMSFAGSRMIVTLATWHIPLRNVPDAISKENISRAVEAAEILARKIRKNPEPKIALCGLNPHAGEGGILGSEEINLINPLAKNLQKKHAGLSLALPPDTVFDRMMRGEFDAAVAMYHDQGLAPLKSVDFNNAVNISMGLKFARTSPDHGTAFGIAGKGLASFKSLESALRLAKILAQ